MIKLQEVENQIVIAYEVYDQRPSDLDLLIAAIETHRLALGCTPAWWRPMPVSARQKTRRPRKPRASSASASPIAPPKAPSANASKRKRWFRNGQKWRTGCEGRISVVKRRHGLNRSRYKGDAGMKRWVGLGVIADNLLNISRVMGKQPAP
jgi:transposase, IS5 family